MTGAEVELLASGIWVEAWPCGCVCAAAVATVTGEGGWTITTEGEAREHFAPPRLAGLGYRLVDSATYRALNGNGSWNCAGHTPNELIHAARATERNADA
ncbi:hypothetical protein [Streptacidiphilus sp. PAMC 29251]